MQDRRTDLVKGTFERSKPRKEATCEAALKKSLQQEEDNKLKRRMVSDP